ncbi:MAG: hypothetical protein EXS35_00850 [Pedosphaera sp.]|nr:hypothetical protein [Pedosphaera sp.]
MLRLLFILLLAATFHAFAATGRVVKVLPHFLDLKGRHSLSPSLYDRDAYQLQLRQHPEQRSALRFDVLWRARGATGAKLKLRAELRGKATGQLPRETTLETAVESRGLSKWSALKFEGEAYRNFGEVTAWRVTLWDGEQLVGEQKSFLW